MRKILYARHADPRSAAPRVSERLAKERLCKPQVPLESRGLLSFAQHEVKSVLG